MIDFKNLYYYMRGHISKRCNIPLDKVIPAQTTNSKPSGVFATFDILTISDANSYLTEKYYDDATSEFVYVTVKDVVVQLSVRNGSPDNTENQINVISLCQDLHKSFTEDSTLHYFSDKAGVSIKSTSSIRSSGDNYPTAIGKVMIFTMRISISDETREAAESIGSVGFSGNIGDFELNFGTDASTPSSVVFTKVSGDDSVDINLSFTTKTIEGRGSALIISETITLPEDFEFDINLYTQDGDIHNLSLLDGNLVLVFRTQAGLNKVGITYGEVAESIFDIDVTDPITISFSGGNTISILNGVSTVFEIEYEYIDTETDISFDYGGASLISKAVLSF